MVAEDRGSESPVRAEETPRAVAESCMDPGRSPPDAAGVELADAIEALHRTLARASWDARQPQSPFTMAPVELTLQVAVTGAGAGAAGVRWYALSPDGLGSRQDGTTHTLKIHLALPVRDEPRNVSVAAGELGSHPQARQRSMADDDSQGSTWDLLPESRLDEVLGAADKKMALVRVRFFYDLHDVVPAQGEPSSPRQVMRIVAERSLLPVPLADDSKISQKIWDGVTDGIEQYAAELAAAPGWSQLSERWVISDPGGLGASTQVAIDLQSKLHRLLLGAPLDQTARWLGAPAPVADALGNVAGAIPLSIIDRPLNTVKHCIELVGILVGMAVGQPMLACSCFKLFAHDEITEALKIGIHKVVSTVIEQSRQNASETMLPTLEPSGAGHAARAGMELRSDHSPRYAELGKPVGWEPSRSPATENTQEQALVERTKIRFGIAQAPRKPGAAAPERFRPGGL